MRFRALGLYLAVSIPIGIAIHLASEWVGLGGDGLRLTFAPIHAYLGVAALLSFVALAVFARLPDGRRLLPLLVRALPFAGRGSGFVAFGVAVQFGFFLVTQFGEGCPLGPTHLLIGLAVAFFGSIAGAIAVSLAGARIVRCILDAIADAGRTSARFLAPSRRRPAFAAPYYAFVPIRGNRPPPYRTTR